MPTFKPAHRHTHQRGVAFIELTAFLMFMVFCFGCMLQLGRALVIQNAISAAASCAGLHLATVPTAEAIDTSKGKAKALEIIKLMRAGAALTATNNYPIITCVNPGTSPCGATGSATIINVRVSYFLSDDLMATETDTPSFFIAQLTIPFLASYPRIGFM